jgi:hypothetical protein
MRFDDRVMVINPEHSMYKRVGNVIYVSPPRAQEVMTVSVEFDTLVGGWAFAIDELEKVNDADL